ncbi:MAG: hypothetical protein OHK93_005783 [Ramalina farinacea]|uniref:Solute carrier family 40 member n=1 Tax=Ramalina farinacea TaxID=258253 RepID=A0AA43QHD1_9LECA|nr:hypothetical protein [Ramalina farinacea]
MAHIPDVDDEGTIIMEHHPFLEQMHVEDNVPQADESVAMATVARRLYVSHFLSTWNSRVFEFGAVLYLATIFPGTLLPMSIYAFARGLAAILFAPAVGQYIDKGDRLQVVRLSIGLACCEKLGSIMNLVSVEKDWVVVVSRGDKEALGTMNAQMHRIDLLCKLLGPLFIALVDGFSTELAIIMNLTMNCTSVGVEYFAIARVYRDVAELRKAKLRPRAVDEAGPRSLMSTTRLVRHWRSVKTATLRSAADFGMYLRHPAFLPSIAGALLYLTVLSFAGQMVTYLLSVGYSATHVGVAYTSSVSFEMLATWVAPWLMARMGPIRAGLWFSSWQVIMLMAGTAVFWAFSDKPLVAASGLVVGTIFSRVGLRGFELCTQLIVQEDVEAEHRGAFSSVEAAWQNAFEILSFTSTIIFSRPAQFRWPALISVLAVASTNSAYTLYVRMKRGHLVHLEAVTECLCGCHREKGKKQERERVVVGL